MLALHATATEHRQQVVAIPGVSPGKLPTGTLRNLLKAVGWGLKSAGRIMARTGERGAYSCSAAPLALPEGVSWEALTAKRLNVRVLRPIDSIQRSMGRPGLQQGATRPRRPVHFWNPGRRRAHHRKSLPGMQAGIKLPSRVQRGRCSRKAIPPSERVREGGGSHYGPRLTSQSYRLITKKARVRLRLFNVVFIKPFT